MGIAGVTTWIIGVTNLRGKFPSSFTWGAGLRT